MIPSMITDRSGGRTTPQRRRHFYTYRGQPLTDKEQQIMIETWGTWSWMDEPDRPSLDDVYESFAHRDVPVSQFPSHAWQRNSTYVARFLHEAKALVMRAMEAILAEYGHGQVDDDDDDDNDQPNHSFDVRSAMFQIQIIDDLAHWDFPSKNPAGDKGGWTTRTSWDGLKRRLLHSIMTEDSFVFAMGGHSAAAGHGYVSVHCSLTVCWLSFVLVILFVVSAVYFVFCFFFFCSLIFSLSLSLIQNALLSLYKTCIAIISIKHIWLKSKQSWNLYLQD